MHSLDISSVSARFVDCPNLGHEYVKKIPWVESIESFPDDNAIESQKNLKIVARHFFTNEYIRHCHLIFGSFTHEFALEFSSTGTGTYCWYSLVNNLKQIKNILNFRALESKSKPFF